MKRKKNAMARAGVALLLSSSMTMNALASTVTTTGTVDVETTAGKSEAVEVTISIATSSNADGGYSVTTTTEDNGVKTQNGSLVDYSGDSKMDTTKNEVTTGTENTKYEVTNGDYHAEGGSKTSIDTNPAGPNAGTVDVPLTSESGKNSNTELGANEVGTSKTDGDTDKTDGEYNYTTETVVGQGSVTVTTEEIKIEENVERGDIDMEHVKSETTPDGSNDLSYVGAAPKEYLPGYVGETVIPEGVEGYEYVYVGAGNTSMLVPAIVFNTPLTDKDKVAQYGENAYIGASNRSHYVKNLSEEVKATIQYDEHGNYVTDENGFILDKEGNRILKGELTTTGPNGETLYLHRFDATGAGHKVEGWYEDGEWVTELNGSNKYTAVWAGPQQFLLVDSKGNIITTYCADFATPTQDDYGYNVENLEDATYYSDEEAARIRSIVKNGYWGTIGNVVDEEGKETTTPKVGSLAAMKEALASAGFTEEELDSLNDGVALTATQMAIWSCSNKMSGLEFVNAHYSNWGTGNVPKEKEDEVKLLFKIYEYLTHLEPTDVENTTADTIINEDNFLSDMTLTVVNKAEGHENNQDDNDDNDAYVTNLTFALVVTPSTERGDDLVVKVIDVHTGKEVAVGRVAGELKDGEVQLTPDNEGNYAFTNITMVEGMHNFNLTLEGVQNLEHGVYLYSSQVNSGLSSQTMVGMAEGEREVNVSMNIKFDLDVKDEIVATEHVWRKEWVDREDDDGGNGGNGGNDKEDKTTNIDDTDTPLSPTPMVMFEDEEVPLSDVAVLGAFEIEDDMIPLAVLPATGDNSLFFMFMSFLSGLSLAGASLVDKMKKRKR